MSDTPRLTEADRHALAFASTATQREWEGVCARGSSQHRQFAKLERMGLLADVGWGVDAEDHAKDVRLFAITDAGLTALRSAAARLRGEGSK